MKLTAKVTYLSSIIDIKKQDWDTTKKQIMCIEEVNEDKEVLDRPAIDFMGDRIDLLNGVSVWDIITVHFHVVHNRRWEGLEEKIFNSLRGWKVIIEKKWEVAKDDLPF